MRNPAYHCVRSITPSKLADAPKFFTDKIRANEKDVWALSLRAEAWIRKGEYDSAIKDLTEAIRLDPSGASYNERGIAWKAQKEYAKPRPCFGILRAKERSRSHGKIEFEVIPIRR